MIHDVVCSWCPIGYQHLSRALEILKNEVDASVHFLPFELNPQMSGEGEEITKHLMRRTGMTQQAVMSYRKKLVATGEDAGVNFDFTKRTHYYHSFKAHCLMHYAETVGKQRALNEVLIEAYFSRGIDISNIDRLLELCEPAGLNSANARIALESDKWVSAVRDKQHRVERLEVGSVPAFLFNREHLVSGSQSVDFFIRYLKQVQGIETESLECDL